MILFFILMVGRVVGRGECESRVNGSGLWVEGVKVSRELMSGLIYKFFLIAILT